MDHYEGAPQMSNVLAGGSSKLNLVERTIIGQILEHYAVLSFVVIS